MKLTWPPQRAKNRNIAAIPLAVSIVLLAVILVLGLPIGRDFKGGTLFMIRGVERSPDVNSVKSQVESLTGSPADVRLTNNGFDIETGALGGYAENQIKDMLSTSFGIGVSSISVGALGPTVGAAQIEKILVLGIGALVAMGAIIFIFRRRVAATAVLIAAGLDIVGVLGLMALFGVPVSLTSIIGILITLGYAIDTNVLLSSRLLKGAVGDPKENIGDSMKAGLVMSAVGLAILLSINVLTTAKPIDELTFTIIFGIIVNTVNTWFLSAAIILRHVERKKVVSYHVSI